jgi:hypothetical protein
MNSPLASPLPSLEEIQLSQKLVLSYAERVIRKISLPTSLTHLILWEFIFLGDYLLGNGIEENHTLLFAFMTLFFASICIATIYCTQVLTRFCPHLYLFVDESEANLKTWYQAKLKKCYEGIAPLAFGVAFSVIALISVRLFINQLTIENEWLKYYRYCYFFIGFSFTGLALWALVGVITIPIDIAKFKIRVSIYQFSGNGLQALGSTFFKMSLSIVSSYVLILGVALYSPYQTNLITIVWMVVGALMIVGFFFFPQINIHKIMVREKTLRLTAFSKHFVTAMENSLLDPSSENMNKLKELFELQQYLNNMNEWPFDTQTLWQLLTALLVPVLLAILEIFF